MPSDAEIAAEILSEESTLRFTSFKSEDAVTIGMNLRKRFRASLRHSRGRGAVISIQSVQGATLFACAVGDGSDVCMDSWHRLEGIMRVTQRTGHSSFYIEKGKNILAKSPEQLGLPFPEYRIEGGAFPIWLVNSPSVPLGTIGIYSGHSLDDHGMIASTLKHFFVKSGGNGGISLRQDSGSAEAA
ncbi:hypothetical protein BS47DRAFT_1374403 [Hydnum rufescens UP504]|uniref:Uncharacterized protein n=1 Tax=Hydnum rufescens UP504 TaxID=1448309 RepID=A0A9P6AG51_9AGAM|nr:hypothetical protein BS47DRAFT_1374403 [Hydnum rufescens UP504]